MKRFNTITGIVAPMDRANVDTDAIIPKQFLTSITRTGLGPHLFDGWRYLDQGKPGMDNSRRPLNPEFVLNRCPYQGAVALLTRGNFGCGSSREHAAWALLDFGIRVVIAPSFADIFFNNCFKNGILPIVLPERDIEDLFKQTLAREGLAVTVNLPAQSIAVRGGRVIGFAVASFRKHRLLEGLDDIALTTACAEEIRAYEARRRREAPWLFG